MRSVPSPDEAFLGDHCTSCHNAEDKKGRLDLTSLAFDSKDAANLTVWIRVHDRVAATGDSRVGWKVGSTSAAGQRGFGLTEPVYAGLFASNRSLSLGDALSRPLTRPSLECEIAVVLQQGLDGSESDRSVMDAIGACHIACEIIDIRVDADL